MNIIASMWIRIMDTIVNSVDGVMIILMLLDEPLVVLYLIKKMMLFPFQSQSYTTMEL